MDIDRCTVVVRSRSLPELYDLALLACRRYAGPLALLTLVGCGPFCLLDWLLLRGLGWQGVYPFLILLAAQAPLATAPIAAYLGHAAFDPGVRPWPALRQAWSRFWLLAGLGLFQGLMTATVVGLIWVSPHAVEVAVLEGQGAGASWRRSQALRAVWTDQWILHLLLVLVLLVASVWTAHATLGTVESLLLRGEPWPEEEHLVYTPGGSLLTSVACFSALAYLAAVRFYAYLDLRTRVEGWEVALGLRRAARRVGEAA